MLDEEAKEWILHAAEDYKSVQEDYRNDNIKALGFYRVSSGIITGVREKYGQTGIDYFDEKMKEFDTNKISYSTNT